MVLPDDNSGSRYQKFKIKLTNGQTMLVAHNIDIATRVSGLSEGDSIMFSGQYEWNEKGGVLHWTHRDSNGSHPIWVATTPRSNLSMRPSNQAFNLVPFGRWTLRDKAA